VEKERKKLKELEEEFNLKLKNLESKERELEEKKKELKNLYEKKIEELISIWNEEFKKIIEGIKKGSTGYRKAIQNFEDFVNKFLESSAREEEIKEGDKVFVLPFKKEGKVLKVKDKMVEVKLGNFKIEVPKGNIIKDYSEMKQPPFKYFKPKDLEDFQKFYEKIEKKEILKLMGLTVEEALEEIEKTLNKAFLEGASKVYLIHGHGTGRLRESVREYLKNHPLVKNFKFADPMEGGTGVTIVYLEEKN